MPRPPLHTALTATLRRRILDGSYSTSGMLPSELALAGEFKRSRSCVRTALATLQHEGLIRPRTGIGHLVVGQSSDLPASIGVVVGLRPQTSDPDIASCSLIDHVERAVQRAGGRIIHIQIEQRDGALTTSRKLLASGCDAFVLGPRFWPSADEHRRFSEWLVCSGIRAVAIDWRIPEPALPADLVLVDWRRAARELATSAIDAGCHRIAWVGFPSQSWSEDRRIAAEMATVDRGCSFFTCPVDDSDATTIAHQAIRSLRTRQDDLIMCANDALARVIVDSGTDRSKVTGFDNQDWARHHRIPSPGIPFRRLVATALDLLTHSEPDRFRTAFIPPLMPKRDMSARIP